MADPPTIPASRILVVMPNWLGDGVMATPFLRALRSIYPDAHIGALSRPLVAPVLSGLAWINQMHIHDKSDERAAVHGLRRENYDLGVLLPNSFRSAWLFWTANVRRRLGYARGGRSWLLTDRLHAVRRTGIQQAFDRRKAGAIHTAARALDRSIPAIKVGSAYQPLPTIEYYLEFARHLCGDETPSADGRRGAGFERQMALGVTADEKAEADAALQTINHQESQVEDPLVVLVPGANFGASKCWMPERFAEVADTCIQRHGAHVLIASAPAERPVADAILAASQCTTRLTPLARLNDGKGISLGALKEIVRRACLMICNDTGPRHFAAAFGVPTVTLFGPTDPVWAETFSPQERIIRVEIPCGPCQLKQCPIDHRCMTGITVAMVMAAVDALWQNGAVAAREARGGQANQS